LHPLLDALIFTLMSSLRRSDIFHLPSLRCLLTSFALCLCAGLNAQTVTERDYRGTPHDEVQKKMLQRDWSGAMQEIDAYLSERPRDPQMRFWRARLLETLQRNDEAMQMYEALAQEFPELAEVQNNLGVMQAALGRMDEAKRSFELALRDNPDLAIAHENLGDVLLHLARRAYAKAESLGNKSQHLSGKTRALESVLQLTLSKP
jgi:Tfp pilus assembly protein PilF